jgi:hypothetical protein
MVGRSGSIRPIDDRAFFIATPSWACAPGEAVRPRRSTAAPCARPTRNGRPIPRPPPATAAPPRTASPLGLDQADRRQGVLHRDAFLGVRARGSRQAGGQDRGRRRGEYRALVEHAGPLPVPPPELVPEVVAVSGEGAHAQEGVAMKNALSSIGLIEPERPTITYRERAPLVRALVEHAGPLPVPPPELVPEVVAVSGEGMAWPWCSTWRMPASSSGWSASSTTGWCWSAAARRQRAVRPENA